MMNYEQWVEAWFDWSAGLAGSTTTGEKVTCSQSNYNGRV